MKKKKFIKKVLKVVVCSSRITKNDMHDVLKKKITLLSQINVHVYFIIVLYMLTYKQLGSLTCFLVYMYIWFNSREYLLYLVSVPHHTRDIKNMLFISLITPYNFVCLKSSNIFIHEGVIPAIRKTLIRKEKNLIRS